MSVHHVGIATRSITDLTRLYGDLLDAPVAHEERVDGMDVTFLDLGNTYLELLEPDDSGPIAAYLDKHGPGIHHVAFGVADAEAALDRATELGVERIDDRPRAGAWGHRIAFLHPDSTGGVLVEFVEEA